MHLVFDIFQGIGIAAAVGIRPFLPGLVAGALAAGDIELSLKHTHVHFLQQPIFLIIMVVGVAVVAGAERWSAGREGSDPRALFGLLAAAGIVIGALFCGGAIARAHHPLWIGLIAGVICAGIAVAATQPLLHRVRARLDAEASGILPVLVDGAAALAAALSIVAPPVGVVLVAALLWLLIAGRGRTDAKYRGLRILR